MAASRCIAIPLPWPIASPPELSPRYNIALTRWGLIPHWAKDRNIGYHTINARAETVASKPAFRNAFLYRRCLIPANGFYEWQVISGSKTKQPWYIVLKDREPMAFSGLWEKWRSPEGGDLESCSIIVTDANELMQPIHDRMPVILAPEDWKSWLETEAKTAKDLQSLLQPYPAEALEAWKVGTLINNPKHDSAECIQ